VVTAARWPRRPSPPPSIRRGGRGTPKRSFPIRGRHAGTPLCFLFPSLPPSITGSAATIASTVQRASHNNSQARILSPQPHAKQAEEPHRTANRSFEKRHVDDAPKVEQRRSDTRHSRRGGGAGQIVARATRRRRKDRPQDSRAGRNDAGRRDSCPASFFQTGSTRYKMAAMTMQTGMVNTQAMTMLPTMPHLRA